MAAFVASWLTPASLFVLLNVMIGTIFFISRLSPSKKPQYQPLGPDGSTSQLARAPSLLDRVKSIDLSFYKFASPGPEVDFSHPQEPQYTGPPLVRAPSLLDRVKSINFSMYNFTPSNPETDSIQRPETEHTTLQPDPPQLSRAPSLLERVKSIDFTSLYRSDSLKTRPEAEFSAELDSDSPTITDHGQVKRSKSEAKVTQRRSQEKMKKSASEKTQHQQEEEEEDKEEVERRRIEKTLSIGENGDVDAKAENFINRFRQQLRLQRLDSLLRYKEMLKGK